MKKISFLIIAALVILVSACEKSNSRKVSYFVTNSQAGFNVSYLDENGAIQSEYITTQSANDKKVLTTYMADAGDIVYISVKDTATTSYVKVKIFIDDKIYKEASRTNDKTMPVTVSGTIPYLN
jgi:hypothetical protein